MEKHAYMIMAHHRPDLLQLLISAIDDKRNDIFIHIDNKSDMLCEQFYAKNAKLIFINRQNINWAGYSQVNCELRLLEEAVKYGHHSYYHLMTGASYPLQNQDTLHAFFDKHFGYEFVGFDNELDYSDRARYYYLFSEYGKLTGLKGRMISLIRSGFVLLQKMFCVDRLKNKGIIIKKGVAYWSITEDLAVYILSQKKLISDIFYKTIWCDEVFVQTLVHNSSFREKVFNLESEYDGALRESAWPSNISGDHPGWNFLLQDLDYLLKSNRLFALKFESPDGVKLIKKIRIAKKIY